MGRGRGRRGYQEERRESSRPLRMSYMAMREAEASERGSELWTARVKKSPSRLRLAYTYVPTHAGATGGAGRARGFTTDDSMLTDFLLVITISFNDPARTTTDADLHEHCTVTDRCSRGRRREGRGDE